MYRASTAVLIAALGLGCADTSPSVTESTGGCAVGQFLTPSAVATCLATAGAISSADRDRALALFGTAAAVDDSLTSIPGAPKFEQAADLTRSLGSISDYYSRQMFPDSIRFHRMLDQVGVTLDFARGQLPFDVNGFAHPLETPYLGWHQYPFGLFFQPLETMYQTLWIVPRTDIPVDSLVQIAERLYGYAVWRRFGNVQFPTWEYEFDWTSGGVTTKGPWISSLAQGPAMMLFAETYRRTGNHVWLDRAYATLQSLRVTWDRGGVLLSDTTHGYWWEGFHPIVMIWNEAAEVVVNVAFLANLTGDPVVQAMYAKGALALKYYTPFFDTGSWTLYSRTQGYNNTFYHDLSIQRLDGLYQLTGDPWYKTTADRWRSYTPPPGIQ